MKNCIYFLLFFFNFSFAYSQEDSLIRTIVAICDEYNFMLKSCYTSETIFNDLTYNIEYSGDNIENGIKNFIEGHPLFFRPTGTRTLGLIESQRESFDVINRYLSTFEETNFLIFYLALGWKILDEEQDSLSFRANLSGDYDANRMYKINALKTDIKFRANILSLNYQNSRQLLSLFDRRTYGKEN